MSQLKYCSVRLSAIQNLSFYPAVEKCPSAGHLIERELG